MLGSTRAGLVRVEMRRARITAERKADARRKIQLGGLISKAGLAFEEPAVLLGMLTAGARVLKGPSASRFAPALERDRRPRIWIGSIPVNVLPFDLPPRSQSRSSACGK
jgi:hypothetical protein